jgi:titin
VTRIVLFVIAGIAALNLALLGGAVIVAALDRRRRKRDIAELDVLWDLSPRPSPAPDPLSASRGSSVATRHREPVAAARFAAPSRSARAWSGRKLAGVTAVAALALVGTASASPGAREAVASAFTTVTSGLGLSSSEQIDPVVTEGTRASAPSVSQAVRGAPSSAGGSHAGSGGASNSSSSSSSSSGDAGGSTITDPGAPSTVATNVTLSPLSSSSVSVVWVDVRGETGYRVERSPDGSTGWAPVGQAAQNATGYVDSGLAPATTYFYRVIGTTAAGDAPTSDVVSVTTLEGLADPPVVSIVAVSSSQIDLGWADVATETGYRIERSIDGATDWITVGSAGQDVTAYSDSNLASGVTYHYRVIATNAAGDSAPSNVVDATTTVDATVPSDPPSVVPVG